MDSEAWEKLDNEDTLQFFKEEKVEGAVYNVYLKKVRYHSSPDDGDDEDDDHKAHLQWRLEEVRVVKCGTVERLVQALGSETGDLDSTYINTFLATYRSFSSPSQVLELILTRYKAVGEDGTVKQQHKEGHRKTLKIVLSVWMDTFPEDFNEPPNFACLQRLYQFCTKYMPESDLAPRAKQKIARFIKEDDNTNILSVEDISIEFHFDLLEEVDLMLGGSLQRPVEFETIPNRLFAEQLTYIDAELFKKVIPHHCLGSIWSRRDKKRGQAPSVYATVNQFNAVSYRVIATVLKNPYMPPTERVLIIEKWIDIAQELRIIKNFSSLKAIVSGLQSNAVYRLKRVWAEVDKERSYLFKELSSIFSEENNSQIWRELLLKEGTAKFADADGTGTIRGHGRKKSGGWGTVRSRKSVTLDSDDPDLDFNLDSTSLPGTLRSPPRRRSFGELFVPSAKKSGKTGAEASGTVRSRKSVNMFYMPQGPSGTVPYLGTFLTDLTMYDTAMKDATDDGLINFDKKRKEFEILAQIRLLQGAAQLYSQLQPDMAFFEWFHSIRVYDENESYELSCEIEPVTIAMSPHDVKGHRKKSSLGFFSPRRPVSLENLFMRSPSTGSLAGGYEDEERDDVSVISAPELQSGPRHAIKHSVSTGSLHSMDPLEFRTSPLKSSECIIVKAYLETSEIHQTNLYKSILLSNSDHAKNVLRNVFMKFDIDGSPSDYLIFQILPHRELQLPERGNVYYAINTSVADIKLAIRRKSDIERIKARHAKKRYKEKYKFTL